VLFRVIREGIGFTQRLTATGTVRLQAIRMLTLEPERLKNQLATTRKDHRRWRALPGRRSSGLRFQDSMTNLPVESNTATEMVA